MNGLHFMLFAGFLINLCYFNVKDSFQKVIVGLNPPRVIASPKESIIFASSNKQKGKKIVNKQGYSNTKNMNKKNMILMSTLLVCSLESFAQSDAEVTDSSGKMWISTQLPWLHPNRW